jgi:hypothetical protein
MQVRRSTAGRGIGIPVLAVGLVAFGLGPLSPFGPAADATAATKLSPVKGSDFNGDGYADLVVAAPDATVSGKADAGALVVLYGGPKGVVYSHRTVISRATPGIAGDPAVSEEFGSDLAKGDLNGDGYTDLVVGGSADSVIIWGGPKGLSGSAAIPGYSRVTDTGDFNGDGKQDIVVQQPAYGDGGEPTKASPMRVLYGPLTRSGVAARTVDLPLAQTPLGAMAGGVTGDFNGDGTQDLLVHDYVSEGVEDWYLYYGSKSGLALTPVTRDVPGSQEITPVVGDINGDGYSDIVGGEDNNLEVAYGSASGIRAERYWQTLTLKSPGLKGKTTSSFYNLHSLSLGDVNGDGFADLALGVPLATVNKAPLAGDVLVLRGSRSGLSTSGIQVLSQSTAGVPGASEPDDTFGYSVQLTDLNRDHHADLVVAAPSENTSTGAVWVLKGASSGVLAKGSVVFGPTAVGLPGGRPRFGMILR